MERLFITFLIDFNPNAIGAAFFMGYGAILIVSLFASIIMLVYTESILAKGISLIMGVLLITELVTLVRIMM